MLATEGAPDTARQQGRGELVSAARKAVEGIA